MHHNKTSPPMSCRGSVTMWPGHTAGTRKERAKTFAFHILPRLSLRSISSVKYINFSRAHLRRLPIDDGHPRRSTVEGCCQRQAGSLAIGFCRKLRHMINASTPRWRNATKHFSVLSTFSTPVLLSKPAKRDGVGVGTSRSQTVSCRRA